MTTGKTIALTRWTFAGKVMSLLFKMLYRLVIAFLPSCKHLLISWLKSPSALILEPRNIVYHCCHCFSIYLLLNDEVGCYDFSSSHVWMWELNHKESWTRKNWCFRIAVLENTLESPLDCKVIKAVNPKGKEVLNIHWKNEAPKL